MKRNNVSFNIIFSDITTLPVDAIVNPTDQYFSGGGGVDMLIHDICGDELYHATRKYGRLHLGEAKATDGFALNARYIIHTSAPHWTGRSRLEIDLLGSCYRNSLSLASHLECRTIAFPLIASRGKHFPKEVAFTTAVNAIRESMEEYPTLDIYLVLLRNNADLVSEDLMSLLSEDILTQYVPRDDYVFSGEESLQKPSFMSMDDINDLIKHPTEKNLSKIPVDESFGSMLERIMKEKNITNTYIQNELEISGAGLWKILNGKSNPAKMTVYALSIALKLDIDEAKEMLMKAGYAINQSSLEDIVLASLISNGIYDRCTIDNLLFSLDLSLLPGAIIE